ncbi:hypothetical protein SOP94_26415 [Peribacillus frigoritolerans]|uniref:hypothetical protein n=1 Tax=Peribacillus frigoritolerans TaxID=450367 RepID=UPI002B249119|nr:hypothetical protein [Peribacillus frigoritolerans]MEB2631950.1 hypothetical protein [Peribacillus frigoritolerans]
MENQKKIKKQTVSIGDVFAVKLPDGRYGALRIVNCDPSCYYPIYRGDYPND